MSHPELVEREDRLEIQSPMRLGTRILLTVLALFPLLAPYELLIRPGWEYYTHPSFFLAALISAGAVVLSAFLLLASIAGLSSHMVFVGSRDEIDSIRTRVTQFIAGVDASGPAL